jgi:hypothetical protein
MHTCRPNDSHHLYTKLTRTITPCESTQTYPLCRLPVDIITRELGEVPEFELQRRHVGRIDETSVFLGRNSLALAEVYHRKREPRRGIERGKNAVREIARPGQVKGVAPGVVVCRKKAAKHADRSLYVGTQSE